MLEIGGSPTVLGHSLSFYLLFALIGLCAGVAVGLLICQERNLSRNFVFRMVIGVLFIGVLAETFVDRIPYFMLPFSYLSGLLMVAALCYITGRVFRQNPWHCCEIGLISAYTYMIFSKLGCFFAGCCHGNPYDGFFSVTYPVGSHAFLQNISLFPIQLVEAMVRTAVLCLIIVIYYKDYFKKYRIPLYFCLSGNSYFWGMLFWYDGVKLINQGEINYILIFNILFGIGTLTCVILHLSDKTRKSLYKSQTNKTF